MLYYYAFSGHKVGLDRVKKAAAILKELEKNGVECRLLINDFRAGLAAREYGISDSITIETIQDIDAVAQIGNSVIIDSPEDDRGRLQKYLQEFKAVFRFAQDHHDVSHFGECMLQGIVVDKIYETVADKTKEQRKLFFLSDADYDKVILKNASLFEGKGIELLLGNYFFVKYEDDLAKLFKTLHEPEEYMELIQKASHIITSSVQTAFESQASGANVYFINLLHTTNAQLEMLKSSGIMHIQNIDTLKFDQKTSYKIDNQLDFLIQKILKKIN